MSPALETRTVAFLSFPDGTDRLIGIPTEALIGTFREREGLTVIAELDVAERLGVPILFRAAWITLTVHPDLAAVGLTAAFSAALGEAGISCNVVAAAYHDHIFVPIERAADAMDALKSLQRISLRSVNVWCPKSGDDRTSPK
jgi:uncharacterized protein